MQLEGQLDPRQFKFVRHRGNDVRFLTPQPSFFVRLGLNFEGKIPLNPS